MHPVDLDALILVAARLELAAERKDLRQYVAVTVADLLGKPDFIEALPGHLPADTASQSRLPLLGERLRRISALNMPA